VKVKRKSLIPKREYFEEYKCGCVSEVMKRRKDLEGYCGKHGDDRRTVWIVPVQTGLPHDPATIVPKYASS
jgi:hypothetical protein